MRGDTGTLFAGRLEGNLKVVYAVFIAVCAAATPVQDCNRYSALHWMAGPASDGQHGMVTGLSGCQVTGMQYAAQSRLVTTGTYAKIFCQPPRLPAVTG